MKEDLSIEQIQRRRLRDSLVASVKDKSSPALEFGRYERYDNSCKRSVRVVPKVSRIQLGETIDISTRPAHRVNPVGKVMATHVDTYKSSCPSEKLQEIVEWGEQQEGFYHNLHLKILAVQARRKGDTVSAMALERLTGDRPPPLRPPNKAARVAALRANVAFRPNGRLYASDTDRKAQLDPRDAQRFEALAVALKRGKEKRMQQHTAAITAAAERVEEYRGTCLDGRDGDSVNFSALDLPARGPAWKPGGALKFDDLYLTPL